MSAAPFSHQQAAGRSAQLFGHHAPPCRGRRTKVLPCAVRLAGGVRLDALDAGLVLSTHAHTQQRRGKTSRQHTLRRVTQRSSRERAQYLHERVDALGLARLLHLRLGALGLLLLHLAAPHMQGVRASERPTRRCAHEGCAPKERSAEHLRGTQLRSSSEAEAWAPSPARMSRMRPTRPAQR